MSITHYRYFENVVTNAVFAEKVVWERAGLGDPRAVPLAAHISPLPPGLDLWVPIFISKSGYDLSGIEHTYNTELAIIETGDGTFEERAVRTSVVAYVPMAVYDPAHPLLPDMQEITMLDFNSKVPPL